MSLPCLPHMSWTLLLIAFTSRGMLHILLGGGLLKARPEIYIQSAPNNSNETYTSVCLGRPGRYGSAKTALKFKYEI